MAGPVYNSVWLFLCTLYPAYASFKAVKNKNVKEYVKWMMYWIVFALFSASECVLDPLLSFWLPFYSEVKVVLLLYLASPITRGSGVVYRRWVHPLLCSKEEEIDIVLEKVKEQGYNTAKTWIQKGVQWLGGVLVNTAIRGGGGLVQQLRRSYSLTDLTESDWAQDRFTDVTEEIEEGPYSPVATPSLRRREMIRNRNLSESGQMQESRVFNPYRILSTESLSSGYNTDQFNPVTTDTMDTEDYELWERRKQGTSRQAYESPVVTKSRKVLRSRAQLQKSSLSDDEDDTFYESFQTPFGQPLSKISPKQVHVQSPESSCYPSDSESTVGDFSDTEYDDVESEVLDNIEVCEDPIKYVKPSNILNLAHDGDKTPTREREASLTMEELQIAAKKLNLCLVTTTSKEETAKDVKVTTALEEEKVIPARKDENVPTVPKRRQTSDQTRELAGNVDSTPHQSPQPDCTQPTDNSTEYSSKPSHANLSTDQIARQDSLASTAEHFLARKDENTLGMGKLENIHKDKYVSEECKDLKEDRPSSLPKEDIDFDIIENIECNLNLNNDGMKVIINIVNSPETLATSVGDSTVISLPLDNIQDSVDEPALIKCQTDEMENCPQSLEEPTVTEQLQNRKHEEVDNEENTRENIDQEIVPLNLENLNTEVEEISNYLDQKSSGENFASINIKDQVEEVKPRSTKKTKAPQPPSLSCSLSSVSLLEPSKKIVHLIPNTSRKQGDGSDETVLPGFDQLELSEDDKEEGKVLYQSPGYPSVSTTMKNDLVNTLPIKEICLPFPTTKIFTHSPSTGITSLRKYDCVEDDPIATLVTSPTAPTVPPLSPRAEYLGTSSSSKCPHCTIHNWLPHSPGCSNKK